MIYFTDPPYSTPDAEIEQDFYGVYRIDLQKGTLTAEIRTFVRPNGIALSPDEKNLYVNDSCSPGDKNPAGTECVASGSQGIIRVYDVAADGSVSHGQTFARTTGPSSEGVPDGMKVDPHGNVYTTGPRGIWVFNPQGNLIGRINMPEVPANLGWGPANWPFFLATDADFHTLYVTARTGLYRVRLKIPGCGRC
jgi:sugar lactone lactonase YvrE